MNDLRTNELAVFETEMNKRDAYKAVFAYGGTVANSTRAKCGTFRQRWPMHAPLPQR